MCDQIIVTVSLSAVQAGVFSGVKQKAQLFLRQPIGLCWNFWEWGVWGTGSVQDVSFSHNAQLHRQMDWETDRKTDNTRWSYCVQYDWL